MAEKNIAVKVQNLTKSFRIPLEASTGLKQKLINTLKGRKGYRTFTPLNDISFEIEEGDFFGIVGRNGSGKSTLLKTIAGIYAPNKGGVFVKGTLVPFIELGVGFNPELSGRENVFLNGALLGFSHTEMEAMYDDIVEFAELEDFMEERLKNYSSGMQVRLAFSIAIQAKGDVLLLDEVLAVGDAAFQEKCYAYFEKLKKDKKTVVLVTHDMGAVERFCSKGMLIDKGKIIKSGDSDQVANEYRQLFLDSQTPKRGHKYLIKSPELVDLSLEIQQNGKSVNKVAKGDSYSFKLKFTLAEEVNDANISMSVANPQGVIVMSMGMGGELEERLNLKKGLNCVTFEVLDNILTDGVYHIGLIFGRHDHNKTVMYENPRIKSYNIYGNFYRPFALTHPEIKIESTFER